MKVTVVRFYFVRFRFSQSRFLPSRLLFSLVPRQKPLTSRHGEDSTLQFGLSIPSLEFFSWNSGLGRVWKTYNVAIFSGWTTNPMILFSILYFCSYQKTRPIMCLDFPITLGRAGGEGKIMPSIIAGNFKELSIR